MYIRQIARRNKDGTRVRYLQLARKVRDPQTGVPRDEVLYHFGREDQLDRVQLERLVRSLARFLAPAERTRVEAELAGLGAELVVEQSLAWGGSYVLDRLWQRLGIGAALEELLAGRAYALAIERLLFALVANRALAPRSKLAVERWVGRRVAIAGLDEVEVHALYRAMDFLEEQADAVQRAVFFSTATLLNLEVDLLFFDTTSTYCEIEEADGPEGLRHYGHSKDHRPDLPQVVIGLAVTREGIPVRCWVLPGETADAATVEMVQRDLAGWKLTRVVWVMDRGMAGAAQRRVLQRGGGHLIVGETLRGREAAPHAALARPGRYQKVRDNLEVKEVIVEKGSQRRRFVIVKNPAEAARDRAQREARLARLEAEIATLNARPRGAPRRKAVAALKSHPSCGRYLRELAGGQLRIDRGRVRAEARLDGKYLLSTTDPSLSTEDVALGYKQLTEVERAFRTLKTTLDLRPLYHRTPERIRAHVLLCWLALLLVRVIETETGHGWAAVRDELEALAQVTLRGKTSRAVLTTQLSDQQRKLLRELKIEPPKPVLSVTQTAPNP